MSQILTPSTTALMHVHTAPVAKAAPTPVTVAMLKPFYVRNATTHADEPERYSTVEEALTARTALLRRHPDALLIVKDRRKS